MAVEDVTHLLDKEEGTAFDQSSILFTNFDGGGVFNYDAADAKAYDKMLDRDGKARTLEQCLTLPIRAAGWSMQRAGATNKVTELIERAITEPANNGGMSTPMNMVLAQALGAIVQRKAYFEKVLTERDGAIIYDKIAWRPATTCAIVRDEKTAAFKGFKQMPVRLEDTEELFIPPERAFVYIHGQNRNPLEGTSDLDIAYWCYITKQKIRFLWYSFLEGQSIPKTIVKADDTTTAREAARDIAKLRQSGVVGVTKSIDVDTLESSGRGATQFKEALDWLNSEASGSVLAGFSDLGSAAVSGTGSFALSKDQTDFFLMSRQAVAGELQDSVNQFLIPDLVRYNFGPGVKSPKFEFAPIAEDDAAMAVTLLQATAQTPIDQSVIPREFFNELIERVAGFLGLSTQKVRDGLERESKQAIAQAVNTTGNPAVAPMAGMVGAVDAATRAVVAKQTGATRDRPGFPPRPGPQLRDTPRVA